MDVEIVRKYCMEKKGVTEGFPFDDTTLVFKVMNKMFALLSLEHPKFINLKCDPERSAELREEFEEIKPGYHMNKEHWNSVYLTGSLNDDLILELIDHSYDLIVSGLPGKLRKELSGL